MNIYFIPGIGADKRIFRHIQVPSSCTPVYLEWISPLKNESLRSYAYRLAEKIDTANPFMIVGLSFGGMLGVEIVKKNANGKLVLISSIPSAQRLPFYYKLAGKLRLHRLLPISILKSASLLKRLFTAETPEQKAYLRRSIRSVDNSFVRWALDAVIKWRGDISDVPYLHIHGSKDFVLPVRYCQPTHLILGGGHLMVLTKTREISNILKEYIALNHAQ